MNQKQPAGLGLVSIALAALAAACSNAPIEPDFETIGHRGSPLRAAENTLPSFEIALEEGADGFETDLCVTQDNRIVIWHDRDPDSPESILRQRGGERLLYSPVAPSFGDPARRPVSQLTLDELRAKYGYARDGERDPDAQIPELSELFNWLAEEGQQVKALYLDIKLVPGEEEKAAFIVQRVHEESPKASAARIYFLSVHDEIALALEAERVRLGAERFRVARDFEEDGALETLKELGLRDATTGLTIIRERDDYMDEIEDLVAARDQGEIDQVVAWTINDPEDQEDLIQRGVDGILTDEPAKLRDVYREILADAQAAE
jgi:glycerophosphoryl diester phosphodiesterase